VALPPALHPPCGAGGANDGSAFRQGYFDGGALAGIESDRRAAAAHFPPTGNNPDELANRPVILRR